MINDPVVEVSCYGAEAFCGYYGYRLPTEAEWEYAARGGLSGKRLPWGDTISHRQANYYSKWLGSSPYYSYDLSPTQGNHPTWNDGISPRTSPVGSFPANGYGLHDMAANVLEWSNDLYGAYPSDAQTDSTGPTIGDTRVIRGGGWVVDAGYCRLAFRYYDYPSYSFNFIGFRVCLDNN